MTESALPHEVVWLQEMERRIAAGMQLDYRDMLVALRAELPRGFQPSDINSRLVYGSGPSVLGLLAIGDKAKLIPDVERAILYIRDRIIAQPSLQEVTALELTEALKMPHERAERVLLLASTVGDFSSGAAGSPHGYSSVKLGREEGVAELLAFKGIATLISERFPPQTTPAAPTRRARRPTESRRLPEFATTFSSYRATAVIGEGGSGLVYAATGDDGKEYAVKLLSAASATQDKARRFKNEILFGTRNQHRNIVSILDHGLLSSENTSARQFYVMQRYQGTLRSSIKSKLNAMEALPLYSQILDGVEAAHLLGVVHRDLKPENVLLDSGGVPLVADFGIARFTADQLATTIETNPQSRLANFAYAAPEQRQPGRTVDHRADIFALGLILNELFTDEVPHGTGYRSIASVAPAFAFLDELVAQMIAQQPSDRPSTIEDVKKVLISRQQAFVSRQRLDAAKKTVIPAAGVDDPIAKDAIRVLGGDWDGHELVFKLSQAPPPLWRQLATSGQGSSFYMNYPPETITFEGTSASWLASESTAQGQIDQFKDRVQYANREYVRHVAEAATKMEEEERRQLEAASQAEERRQQLAAKLKF